MRHLIIAQSRESALALGLWLEAVGERPLQRNGLEIKDERCLLCDDFGNTSPSSLFDRVAVKLWKELCEVDKRLTVLVDSISLETINPLAGGWESAVGMWVLALPEITWKFGVILGADDKDHQMVMNYSLASLLTIRIDPLFDGLGLRDRVRQNARKSEGEKLTPYLALREQVCLAMDDEVSYAYFNSFVGYRFGFRAHPVRRWAVAQALLGSKGAPQKPFISFEDIYLNFPDKPDHMHLSDLSGVRRENLPTLNLVSNRRFVSSSQTVVDKNGTRSRNQSFIRSIGGMEIPKPLSGMFDLWSKAKLDQCLKWQDPKTGKTIRGVGEGFHWPPPKHLLKESTSTGHGSPGRLLQVAELMIRRAEKMLHEGVTTVREAVAGAVLATDAIELLGNKTPTTSIEALGLKHQFEVLAECQFSGTEYHIEIKPRLEEIHKECMELSKWFNPAQAKMAAWNAEMHIVNQLVRILREHNQFDEEAICMNRVRQLHNRLWVRQKPPIFRPILMAITAYASWLMASFLNFAISFFGCIFLLGGLRWWVEQRAHTWDDMPNSPILRSIVIATQDVFAFFVGANDLHEQSWGMSLVLGLAAILGLIHLGIFLSFLYSIIARKS